MAHTSEAVYLAVREDTPEPELQDFRRWDSKHTPDPEAVPGWVVVATLPYDPRDPNGRADAYTAAGGLDGDTSGHVYPSPDPDLPLGVA